MWLSVRSGFIALLLANVSANVSADDWGDLSGRFVLDGDFVEERSIQLGQNRGGWKTVADESLLVNEQSRGIANVVVFIRKLDREFRVHPAYGKSARESVELQFSSGRYSPHVLLLRTSQTLTIVNQDNVPYAPQTFPLRNPPLSILPASQSRIAIRMTSSEPLPIQVKDCLYPWIRSYIVVCDHPYMAKTDEDGFFEVRRLPVGVHRVRFWHERIGYLKSVRIDSDSRVEGNDYDLRIEKGANKLPVTHIHRRRFERASDDESD